MFAMDGLTETVKSAKIAKTAKTAKTARNSDKRTLTSCERCQGRKIKCYAPVPGPCRACSRANQRCVLSQRKKVRPFYQITNEQFGLILDILNICVPGIKLDLESLTAVKEKLTGQGSKDVREWQQFSPQNSSSEPSEFMMDFNIRENSDNLNMDSVTQSDLPQPGQQLLEQTHAPEEPIDVSSEMATLEDENTNVVLDISGFYKYVGPIGEASFNLAALNCLAPRAEKGRVFRLDPATASRDGLEPVSLGSSMPQCHPWEVNPFLPPREIVDGCAKRFFEQIQSSVWLVAEDRFYTQLDLCYSSKSKVDSSWLCFLYASLSLTAPTNSNISSSDVDRDKSKTLTSAQYFSLSMNLLPAVIQYPDVNGVRALVALCLALQRKRTLTSMYILVGIAVRIAQSLGLHLDRTAAVHKPLEWHHMRRLWWTVYELEHQVCISNGVAPSITDASCSKSLPLENLVPPGFGVPVGYLSYSTSLAVLSGQIHQVMTLELDSPSGQASTNKGVCSLLRRLEDWSDGLPSYLRYDAPLAPAHRRSVAILHLNYWITRVYICRRFLLFYVIHRTMLESEKTTFFEKMAYACIDAAEEIIQILSDMATFETLSDLSFFDTNCLLKTAIIFRLANRIRENESDIKNYHRCISLLEKMSDMEWPAEVVARMRLVDEQRGIGQSPVDSDEVQAIMEHYNSNASQTQGDSFINSGLHDEVDMHWYDDGNPMLNNFLPPNADVLAWGPIVGWDMDSFNMPLDSINQ